MEPMYLSAEEGDKIISCKRWVKDDGSFEAPEMRQEEMGISQHDS